MKQRLKKFITDKNLYLFSIITIMFFGIFVKLEYATDTYCVFATSTKQYCEHFLYSGRPLSAAFLAFTNLLGFSPNAVYLTSFIIAIVSTTVSMYVLFNVIKKDIKNEAIGIIISILVIINLFSIELYLFLEKGILTLSVLFCVLAFSELVKYIKSGKIKFIIITFVYMLFANFSYQGTVGLFVALSSIYIIKNSENIKKFIKNNFITALCYGIPALINYLIVKYIFNNSRVSNEFDIQESVNLIIKNTNLMITESFNIIPKYVFLVSACILLSILVITILIKREKIKNKIILLLDVIYVIVAVYVVTVFPQVLQSTASIGFAPRNTYTFASIIGIILLYIFFLQKNSKMNILTYIAVGISLVFIIFQYIGFSEIERNRYILNYNDYYNAIQIQKKVAEYEKETGNQITKVAVYKQNGNSGSYPELWISGDINVKATAPDWSRMDYLRYYLDRNLEQVEEDKDIYDLYFKNKNWEIFDIEQVILIKDTLHFCMY